MFGVLDVFAGGGQSFNMIIARLFCVGVMALITIIFCFNSHYNLSKLDDSLILAYLVVPAITIIGMTMISDAGTSADTYPFGLVILFAYGGSLLNPRAINLTKLCGFTFICYLMSIPFSNISNSAVVVNLFFMSFGMMAVCVGSITRENLEREQQINDRSLVELNAHLEKTKIEALQARDEAVTAQHIQSNFISSLSHELRTPLNAILGFSEMMQQEIYGPMGSPNYKEYVDDINWSGQSLLLIVDDLLDVQRLENGRMKWANERFSINDMLSNAVMVCSKHTEQHGVAIRFDPSPMQFDTQGDTIRLSQAFTNLLTNAVKFSERNDVVTVSQGMVSNGEYRITVSDNGIGISEHDIERVMQPFEQVEGNTPQIANDRVGLGLGLSIAQGIFKRMGARFVIESELGVGTQCHVYIPANKICLDRDEAVRYQSSDDSANVVSLRR